MLRVPGVRTSGNGKIVSHELRTLLILLGTGMNFRGFGRSPGKCVREVDGLAIVSRRFEAQMSFQAIWTLQEGS